MIKKILLTSFDTWLPHHKSNSSDELLKEIAKLDFFPHSLTFLRQLPVNVELASRMAIAKIDSLKPDVVICCGMAESRCNLSIESQATCGKDAIATKVNLDKLVTDLTVTVISHDAGQFVCEGLYYSILNHLQESHPNSHCIFVHVPTLNKNNLINIVADFLKIIQKIVL